MAPLPPVKTTRTAPPNRLFFHHFLGKKSRNPERKSPIRRGSHVPVIATLLPHFGGIKLHGFTYETLSALVVSLVQKLPVFVLASAFPIILFLCIRLLRIMTNTLN